MVAALWGAEDQQASASVASSISLDPAVPGFRRVVGGVFTVSALVDRVINFALNGARKREAKGAGIGYIFQ